MTSLEQRFGAGMSWPIIRVLLSVVLSSSVVVPASAQTSLQLRWELVEDVFGNATDRGTSRAAFAITNRDSKSLPRSGWAIYFNAMRRAQPDAVATGGVTLEPLLGTLYRLVPTADFLGLAPGGTLRVEYTTSPAVGNVSFSPTGPYLVFDAEPTKGHVITDYQASVLPRRTTAGRDRVVSPEAQYALNEVVRDLPEDALTPVFPTPLRYERREGRLGVRDVPRVTAPTALKAEVDLAAGYFRAQFPGHPSRAAMGPPLHLEVSAIEGQHSPEAYELVIDPRRGIRVTGNTAVGVFYGLQSLRSLLPPSPTGAELLLPAVRIVDAPRFAYRGLMLDVARNFQTKDSVLRVLELMARYKLNVLHFHLTDDEGWRIAIHSLPELTEVGARRGHTLDSQMFLPPAFGSGPEVGRPFGSGFYTRDDYVEILKTAAALKIEVIPEIEMPGHARAAIKAMDARARRLREAGDSEGGERFLLSEPSDRSVYTSAQNYHDNVMNPALASTYAFIEQIVDAVAAMHRDAGVPLRTLHMGGDEVPAGVWERSPIGQAYMAEHGQATTDGLWFAFYSHVDAILKSRGLNLAGWEEIAVRRVSGGAGRVAPNVDFTERQWHVYVWNNIPGRGSEDLAYRLANAGYKVVLSPVTNLYFDLAYNRNPEEGGLDWGGYVDVDKPFQLIPLDYHRSVRADRFGRPIDAAVFTGKQRLSDIGRRNVIGVQGNLWSETLNAEGRLDFMLVPKLFGLAERAWAPDPEWAREPNQTRATELYEQAWSQFLNVLGKRELPRLAREQPNLRYRIPTPGLRIRSGAVLANLQVPGFTLRYTTDGTEPSNASPQIHGPLRSRGRIRVAAFDPNGRRGHAAVIEQQ